MTREEINNELDRAFEVLVHCGHMDMRRREAFYMAIQALSAEQCDRCVSLQEVHRQINKWVVSGGLENHDLSSLHNRVDALSFVIPKQKTSFDGMTNGEMLMSLYPNLKYLIQNGRVITTIGVASSFDLDWWNEPYKAKSEETE